MAFQGVRGSVIAFSQPESNMGLRCGSGDHQPPIDRMQLDDAVSSQLNILMLETLLKTKTDLELAAVFPSIKPEQLAALRKHLRIPEP